MSADELIRDLSWATFFLLFIVVAVQAIRDPRLVTVEIALLFSTPALIILTNLALNVGLLQPMPVLGSLLGTLILVMAYLLMRLVQAFSDVPAWLMRGAAVGLALITIGLFAWPDPRPPWFITLALVYLIGCLSYVTAAFARESMRSRGVTRRRMQAAALGSLLLVLVFVISSIGLAAPSLASLWRLLSDTAGLAAAVSFFLSFASPRWLRRAWQEPSLRAFLERAASLPRLPNLPDILAELEAGVASSLGAPSVRIGLWNPDLQALVFPLGDANYRLLPSQDIPAARAYRTQKAVFTDNLVRDHPGTVQLSRAYNIRSLLAAPISVPGQQIGVLVAYAPHSLIFAEDDLSLVQLLADQAAVVLEIRRLIDEATHNQARTEAARLKEDFLSAAAHDLKTPLTSLIAKAQMMERAATRQPAAPADRAGLQLIVRESQRLRHLVLELLDAARVEQGQLVNLLSPVDLVGLAEEICTRLNSPLHPCTVVGSGPILGMYDQIRMVQLLENLVENAIKYSPQGSSIQITIRAADGHAHLSVADNGIGISAADLPYIFERFFRGTNVNDRQFAGMGLGLFICRGIVEQHGGRIWVDSQAGLGTTFHIDLPLLPVGEKAYA